MPSRPRSLRAGAEQLARLPRSHEQEVAVSRASSAAVPRLPPLLVPARGTVSSTCAWLVQRLWSYVTASSEHGRQRKLWQVRVPRRSDSMTRRADEVCLVRAASCASHRLRVLAQSLAALSKVQSRACTLSRAPSGGDAARRARCSLPRSQRSQVSPSTRSCPVRLAKLQAHA